MKRLLAILVVALFIASKAPLIGYTKTPSNKYVRTANIYLMGGPVLDGNLETLSKFDVLVLPVEDQVYNKPFFEKIRAINPDIIILAYVATVSWNDAFWSDPLHQAMYPNIKPDWWLTDSKGKTVSVWPNTRALNLNTEWKTYLANHVKNDVLSTGLWDGIFYDEVQDSISWVGAVDVNKDGIADSAAQADDLWESNYQSLFETTRSLIGKDYIMITNGSSNPVFAPYVNGRMFETFPSSNNTLAEWKNATRDYLKEQSTVGYPALNIINVNTVDTGTRDDYKSMRFGITTTLLADGYFGFDFGTTDHAQTWTYDEYNASLGAPKSTVTIGDLVKGVLDRQFENGRVLVNATDTAQTIDLGGDFEKIHGVQDPTVNDGSIVSQITLATKDGIILLRPIDKIENGVFQNGAFARIFSADGKTKRNGFFAYDNTYRGGQNVMSVDLNHDRLLETVVADHSTITIYNADKTKLVSFAPYTAAYNKGVSFAVGDLENDGSLEIITGTQKGGGPQIRIFNKDGKLINPGFFAYDKKFRGGVNVAIGDLNGDGTNEIITGAGPGGTSHIRVFNKNGKLINPGFFAYDKSMTSGVFVGAGDVDHDGKDEIVTGPGKGSSPEIRVFTKDGKKRSSFFASKPSDTSGVPLSVIDLDQNGDAEIVTYSTNVFTISGN